MSFHGFRDAAKHSSLCARALRALDHPVLDRVQARLLRSGLQVLDVTIQPKAPPPLRRAFTAVDHAITQLIREGSPRRVKILTPSYTVQLCKHS